MGCCGSSSQISPEEAARNRKLEESMRKSQQKSSEIKRLLFLGTGGSGKSTFMKQIIQNYGNGFSDQEKAWWKNKASMNVIQSLNILCTEAIAMKTEDEKKVSANDDDQWHDDFSTVKQIEERLNSGANRESKVVFDAKEANIIERLWNHELTQFGYDHRGNFPFDFGDIAYYFTNEKLQQLSDPEYVLSHDDITFVRSKTNGVYEQSIMFKGVEMIFIDVAGQRSSRKKWIGCFSDVTAVIWVSALDNYNEVLTENVEVNAMDDAIEAFRWAITHPMLEQPSFALFLNKIDLLERKVCGKPKQFGLKNFFEDYDGEDGNVEQAAEFLKEIFLSVVPPQRKIASYTVQGTDSANANKVLDSVIFGLLENQMNDVFG